MTTTNDIITQVANYDTTLHGDAHGKSYAITGRATIDHGVKVYIITIEYDTHTTTTAALVYEYHDTILAIDQLQPVTNIMRNLAHYTWTHTLTGKQATIYNNLPRIY